MLLLSKLRSTIGLGVAAVACAASVFWVAPMLAQSKASDPRQFDVAAIKPNSSDDYRLFVAFNPGGRFSATGITLRLLMRYAYDVQNLQITGGPKWIGNDRWNVEAKAEGIPGSLSTEQSIRLIRALLVDRFRLKVHFEQKKQMPAYALVVVKSGPKLNSNTGEPGPDVRVGRGHMSFKKARMATLAAQLTRQLGRQVLDQTALNGEYDFALDWVPDPSENSSIPGQPGPPPDPVAGEDGPSIFTALQEQLGLRLTPTKAPLDVIIIDRVEKPSEN